MKNLVCQRGQDYVMHEVLFLDEQYEGVIVLLEHVKFPWNSTIDWFRQIV